MSDFCLQQGQGLPKGLGGTPSTQTPFECSPRQGFSNQA